jgi:glyoxalase family protein
MTFFPWEGAAKGRIGAGQVITTAYSIPATSLGYWTQRLVEHGVRFEKPKDRFGDTVLAFEDPDGLRLGIVATDDRRVGYASGPTPAEHSIRGFHHAALAVRDAETTTKLMTDHLGFRRVDEAENRVRLAAGDGTPGNLVDVIDASGFPRGTTGVGTVHHIAFRVPDDDAHLAVREEVAGLGYDVTPVLDRNYFRSIYFREPGGVLFEIATDPPGFAADEDAEHLGESLKLPPWLEERRGEIEDVLTPLRVPGKEDA